MLPTDLPSLRVSVQCAGPVRPQLPHRLGSPPSTGVLLAVPQQAFLANPDLGNWAVLALPYLSFLLKLNLSLRKQDRNCHIWASGGNVRQADRQHLLLGRMGPCWFCREALAVLKTLEEQGWSSSLLHPGRLVVLEGVNLIPCGLCSHQPCSCCWDIWQRLSGQLYSGPEHKGVNCAELSVLPPPALPLHCTSCV